MPLWNQRIKFKNDDCRVAKEELKFRQTAGQNILNMNMNMNMQRVQTELCGLQYLPYHCSVGI